MRVGHASTAQGQAAASLIERRESFLLDAGAVVASTVATDPDSHSARAAVARQESRARKVRDLVATGDLDAAARLLAAGISEGGARGSLGDALARRVANVTDFWGLRRLVDQVAAGADAHAAAQETARVIQDRLGTRLDELLEARPIAVGNSRTPFRW